MRVPWTARRSTQSVLKETSPEYSLEGLMVKLKLQCFGHLIRRANLEKILMLGKIDGKRKREWQRMRWLDSTIDSTDMNLSKLWEIVKDREAWLVPVTADGDCSHEIKRRLLLGRKVMTNLDSILKSRDITLPTKVCLVKAMVFPVVMYGCESWTVKKLSAKELMFLNCGAGEDS